ncbi:uncharacterized protein LOC126612334 isoform X2 [Malus sylvestris]|uniref:uncharacterized protein LOC126612334 isoform X2 n=1 Tax=Malus sylvestris TaxID=3752 RepID=UPI0021ABAC2D|nr:uncharacterized protein LOC126612334 isoform X2 [Malus sylvestris]
MALIRTAANSDLRPLKWSSYFLLHFNSIVQLLNSVLRISFRLCGPMGVSALIRLGLMPRKPISLLWTPQPPGAVFQNPLSLGCRAAIPESEDVQKEEEEEEEESRGVSKAFSFVKVGRHTYIGNVGMSRLGWRRSLMEEDVEGRQEKYFLTPYPEEHNDRPAFLQQGPKQVEVKA